MSDVEASDTIGNVKVKITGAGRADPSGSGGERGSDPPSSRQAVWGEPRENPRRRPKDRATSQH